MEIDILVKKLEKIIQWQDQKIDGQEIPDTERTRISAGLIDLALEHEKSIGILANSKMYGSVFALLRPLFEAYIRAVWIRYCVSNSDLDKFKKSNLRMEFGTMIKEIENIKGYDVGVLSDIKKGNWKLMNDFTHGGVSQAASRNMPNAISSDYPEKDIVAAINFSISIGLMATMEIANIVGNKDFAREVLEKMESSNNAI